MENVMRPVDHGVATRADIQRLQQQISDLTARVEQQEREIHVHVTRMGQVQADIDLIRAAWARVQS